MKLDRNSDKKQVRIFAIQLCILLLKAKREEISIKELLEVLDNYYGLGIENPVTYEIFNCLYKELVDKSSYGFLKLKSSSIDFYEKMKKPEIKNVKQKQETPSPKVLTDRELIRFIYENKSCYTGKKIRGLDIWGIGPQAITLGNISINAHSDGTPTGCGPIRQCHNKEFHNFFRKIKRENSFDDGIELAKEIIQEYGYLSWKEESEKYRKEMQKVYGDY